MPDRWRASPPQTSHSTRPARELLFATGSTRPYADIQDLWYPSFELRLHIGEKPGFKLTHWQK